MELEVGMYVRTKYGIAKYLHKKVTTQTIYYVVDKDIVFCNIEGWEDVLTENEIIKVSHNIIDLIEVGDYVNGYIVENVVKDVLCSYVQLEPVGLYVENYEEIDEKDIKSIVTKEQFSTMEYKLGDK